jgi:hypothetical protein
LPFVVVPDRWWYRRVRSYYTEYITYITCITAVTSVLYGDHLKPVKPSDWPGILGL